MINKKFLFIYFIVQFFTFYSILCQSEKQKTYYLEVDMEYFIIKPFISDYENISNFDPTELLNEVYSKCDMISLNVKNRNEWPERAINHPHLVMYIESELLEEGENYGIPEMSIKEKDFNGNQIQASWFPTKNKCKRNKLKCIESIIKSFKDRYENKPFLFGYENQRLNRIIYPKSGPLYTPKETVSVTKTDINWKTVDNLLDDNHTSIIEGIYTTLDSTGAKYTIGIFKTEVINKIIILDSNVKGWEEGDLKGTIEIDSKSEDFKTKWITADGSSTYPSLILRKNGLLEVKFNETWLKKTKIFKKMM